MVDTVLALSAQASGIVDAAGRCVLTLGPSLQHEEWSDVYLSVTNTGALIPLCKIYNGAPSDANYLQGTEHGVSDGAQLDLSLRSGNVVTCVWTGATVGSECVASVSGTRTLRGVKVAYG